MRNENTRRVAQLDGNDVLKPTPAEIYFVTDLRPRVASSSVAADISNSCQWGEGGIPHALQSFPVYVPNRLAL
jgi:hypothetical protein